MSYLSEIGLYDMSIARRSPVTGTDGSHCFQSVLFRVRRKRHSLGIKMFGLCIRNFCRIQYYMFWENRLMKISLEMFIYDIPTRPKVMVGQFKIHEIHLC